MDSLKNRATSALLGALIGDAAGATLEFLGRKPTASEVAAALELPGGGYWKLNPGQITDDGELTLALARALESSGSQFSIAAVARSYANWIESKPFDLGQTIIKAFAIDTPKKTGCDFLLAKRMRQQARGSNFESKANGSLMRAVPLAIWGHRLPNSQLAQLAFLDSELSHPNPSCKDAVACYLIALAHLLNTGNRESAFEAAYNWVLERESEPTSWLEQVKAGQIQAAHPQAGFVKIAFQRAFHHLHGGSNYLDAIQATLNEGGDTDTNACIVGGLIGAVDNNIPQNLVDKVLSAEPKGLRERPLQYAPSDAIELALKLVDIAPAELTLSSEPSFIVRFMNLFGL